MNNISTFNTKQTYEVNFRNALKIYRDNEKFRKVLSSGNFIYCENRFVINDTKYIKHKNGKLLLTKYAKTHESECCLIFQIKY